MLSDQSETNGGDVDNLHAPTGCFQMDCRRMATSAENVDASVVMGRFVAILEVSCCVLFI
jgi:hypothetical protein